MHVPGKRLRYLMDGKVNEAIVLERRVRRRRREWGRWMVEWDNEGELATGNFHSLDEKQQLQLLLQSRIVVGFASRMRKERMLSKRNRAYSRGKRACDTPKSRWPPSPIGTRKPAKVSRASPVPPLVIRYQMEENHRSSQSSDEIQRRKLLLHVRRCSVRVWYLTGLNAAVWSAEALALQ
ncbi:hypothetical protein EVAR_64620_1 [Eumeta japonica]|uniref:Uncharacterized protein n=1 Tax=Eumeta variegata TaxID=151549 RepID=A0A4C1ZA61_EUMVA|nr:hypothetical protein EVAR_64620_1 [Eumeta japonica]